ncbi:hypothetical protein [Acidovorax sp. NCPPB 4044]|uniref:hypothetical protein n=1 Tax=Acidovorax sp. NCPPB 4044 TaxID=2940490 RepID=UPI002304C53D|nr:hypothetical protein [Acidovorax sp. NCPPB 4044]MDA8522420.1 hypothetical protein [Acidovorax sp. NCPPB 4044]
MNIDIGHIRNVSWAKDNDDTKWIAYNRLRGQYMSALEHAVPERFFNDPAKCNLQGNSNPTAGLPECPQGISSVKALGIAAAQGQRIYTITRKVYSENPGIVSSALSAHSYDTQNRVQQSLDAGYEVTISERPLIQSVWTGAGFISIDPQTGSGGYTIEGGTNGGSLGDQVAAKVLNILQLNVETPIRGTATMATTMAITAVSFTSMWISNVVECYKSDFLNFLALIMIAIAAAYIIASIPGGREATGAAIAIIIPDTASAAQQKDCQISCSKATRFHFSNAMPEPITDVEQFKIDEGFGPPTSPFDVCACEDGSLVIYSVSQCGRINWKNFPHVTGHRWK